ncbi:hypothetical protein [Sphingobium sp. YR768]|uniref:hypothetical protein n=1 Tax=Sphingobium sp. YR768 TaxID=1884365 RepID=UPI0008B57C72|nr:hypothetical protein [Sphingobium sp. YR768]SER90142.1 hypothetical protein SAMN05518866_1248 [Sphingobium sp. YR768]
MTAKQTPKPISQKPLPSGVRLSLEASVQREAHGHMGHPDPYQMRELRAQEVTATASIWMAFAALATLLVTSAGTFFIWRQIRLTRDAVREAIAATNAAVEGNNIAREIGQAQARCYLSPRDVKFRIDTYAAPHLYMTVLNSGQSPARNFRWTFQVTMRLMPDGWQWGSRLIEPGGGRDIAAQQGEAVQLGIAAANAMPQGQLSDLLLEPTVRIEARIVARWSDVFGVEQEETWFYQAIAPTGLDMDIPMIVDFPAQA